jgi:hypothetical protein
VDHGRQRLIDNVHAVRKRKKSEKRGGSRKSVGGAESERPRRAPWDETEEIGRRWLQRGNSAEDTAEQSDTSKRHERFRVGTGQQPSSVSSCLVVYLHPTWILLSKILRISSRWDFCRARCDTVAGVLSVAPVPVSGWCHRDSRHSMYSTAAAAAAATVNHRHL